MFQKQNKFCFLVLSLQRWNRTDKWSNSGDTELIRYIFCICLSCAIKLPILGPKHDELYSPYFVQSVMAKAAEVQHIWLGKTASAMVATTCPAVNFSEASIGQLQSQNANLPFSVLIQHKTRINQSYDSHKAAPCKGRVQESFTVSTGKFSFGSPSITSCFQPSFI